MTSHPQSQPGSAVVSLSDRERVALIAMADRDEDHYADFATIASDAKLDRKCIRRTVRALARKGLAEYARGLWTEDGEPAGSGYRCTKLGRHLAMTFEEPRP